MIFLDVKIENMFGIEYAFLDLKYPRKVPSSPIEQSIKEYKNINYKKVNVIMGANASGKTSIAKTMCYIQNFLNGRTLSNYLDGLGKAQYKDNDNFGFEVMFYTKGVVYLVEAIFNSDNLILERWKKLELTASTPNAKVRERLQEEPYIYEYEYCPEKELIKNTMDGDPIVYEHKSSYLSYLEHEDDKKNILFNNHFSYRFSGKQLDDNKFYEGEVDVDFLEKILQSFDPSIKKIFDSIDEENVLVIEFENGHQERIKNGKISKGSVLSSGTQEAVSLALVLYAIRRIGPEDEAVFFIDEQMAFSHSDMEEVIIKLIMNWIQDKDVQVFVTTHNKSILNLGLPVFNYTFLKRNSQSNEIEVIHPEEELLHKSRTLKKVVEDDIFSVSPSIDKLLDLVI